VGSIPLTVAVADAGRLYSPDAISPAPAHDAHSPENVEFFSFSNQPAEEN